MKYQDCSCHIDVSGDAYRALLPVPRWLIVLLVLVPLAADSSVIAQDEADQLPHIDDMVLPTFEALMQAEPFDWVVLKNDLVVVTEPVYPRPDPLTALMQEKADLEKKPRKTQRERERLVELRAIDVILLEDQSSDYRLPFTQVKQIISFPMIMLRRVDELLKEKEIGKAYELLVEVDKLAPGWEQAKPQFDALLLREAEVNVDRGNVNAALALLDELANRNIDNPQLPVVMARLIQNLFEAAIASEDYPRARYHLGRMARHFPKHEAVVRWQSQMEAMMNDLLQQAQQKRAAGDHAAAAELARQASRVWSPTGNIRVQYTQLASRYQTLRVPVRRFSDTSVISPIPLEADDRHRELTVVSLFEPTTADELTYFQSTFFDLWDPRDLGREVVFSIQQHRPYWQSQPVLSANQIADALSGMLQPSSDSFNPRMASFINEFSVRSPTQLRVSFRRVPLNLEALFRFSVQGIPEEQQADPNATPQVLSSRFALVDESEDRRLYRRTIPEPDGLNERLYHLAEIEELRYPDRGEEIRAFNREEVDVLPHLLPWEVDLFKKFPDKYAVQQYAIPQTHVIVFNPLSESVMNSSQLRRALSFGVDRENLLKIVLLRDPDMKYGRPVSAPWHTTSYANSPLVEPPVYDHYLSYLLRLASVEQLRIPDKQQFVADAKARALEAGEDWDEEKFRLENADAINASAAHITQPKLKMLIEPDEVVELAAEKIVERWTALGFEVEVVDAGEHGPEPDDWDMMYRRVRMEEPLLDLWSLLLTDDRFDVTRLSSYPDWMRQELINLDYATSFVDAQQKLFTIHRHMEAQAFIIPLWEIDDFMVFPRQRVKNFHGRPMSVYHGVEQWKLIP